jgi:hypothetical protein
MAYCFARQGNGHGLGPHYPDTLGAVGSSECRKESSWFSQRVVPVTCPLTVIPLFFANLLSTPKAIKIMQDCHFDDIHLVWILYPLRPTKTTLLTTLIVKSGRIYHLLDRKITITTGREEAVIAIWSYCQRWDKASAGRSCNRLHLAPFLLLEHLTLSIKDVV